jgi:hypothetical protein
LRDKLKRLQEEFDAFKMKSAKDYETMQSQLNEKTKKELAAMKERYEAMLDELRRNAAGDKEFVMNELKKRIVELEKIIEDLRSDHAKEREQLIEQQKQMQAKNEQTVADMRRDQQTTLQQVREQHSSELETLNKAHDRKLESQK